MLAASPKHFAVHSGPEKTRLSFIANATESPFRTLSTVDMTSTSFSFRSSKRRFAVSMLSRSCLPTRFLPSLLPSRGLRSQESPAGEPDVANPFLIQTLLRDRWQRPDIHVMSDNTAVLYVSLRSEVKSSRIRR